MTTWSSQELARIGEAEELQVAPTRPDGGETAWFESTGAWFTRNQ